MHFYYQIEIPPTIPRHPIDHYGTYTVRKKEKIKIKKCTLSLPSLPTATAKKPTPTFYQWKNVTVKLKKYLF